MRDRFLRACWRKPVDRTPAWYMRQAGRYLLEYRDARAKRGILEIAKDPKFAAELARLPIEKFGVDAAILFADIMIPLEAMGVRLEIREDVGPIILDPIREATDVDRLGTLDPDVDLPFLAESIGLLRDAVEVPVIGFSGAPFTLAAYLIEGGPSRDFAKARAFMYRDEAAWHRLLGALADMVAAYTQYQVRVGAQAIQLFDSWVGALGPDDYVRYVLPHTQRAFVGTDGMGIPRIHFGTNTGTLLEAMRDAGGEVIGIDWRIPIDEAWRRVGDRVAIQGNLDPATLLAGTDVAVHRARDILDRVGCRPGHIFNLGHGVPPGTSPETLAALTKAVHAYPLPGGTA